MAETHLWYWRYSLTSRAPLNARTSQRHHEGALIRDFGGGVGCVHPWPALGDASLDEQLAALAADRPTELGLQSLRCAEADGLARREGRRLFDPLKIPPSHFSAGSQADLDDPARLFEQGFRSVKLKGSSDFEGLKERLEHWRQQAPEMRLRIDFNDTASYEGVLAFWQSLDEQTRAAVDFLEDPFPYVAEHWKRAREEARIPLAADREVRERSEQADWLVVKPAVINSVEPGELAHAQQLRMIFTSYLDHAVGQLYAAWRAAECAPIFGSQLGDCGLLTHEAFEPDPFFEALTTEGPRLIPPPGTGLGFDDLLEDLPWKPLN